MRKRTLVGLLALTAASVVVAQDSTATSSATSSGLGSLWNLIRPVVVLGLGVLLNFARRRVPRFQDRFMIPAIAALAWLLELFRTHLAGALPALQAPDHMTLPAWLWATVAAVFGHRLAKDATKPKPEQVRT